MIYVLWQKWELLYALCIVLNFANSTSTEDEISQYEGQYRVCRKDIRKVPYDTYTHIESCRNNYFYGLLHIYKSEHQYHEELSTKASTESSKVSTNTTVLQSTSAINSTIMPMTISLTTEVYATSTTESREPPGTIRVHTSDSVTPTDSLMSSTSLPIFPTNVDFDSTGTTTTYNELNTVTATVRTNVMEPGGVIEPTSTIVTYDMISPTTLSVATNIATPFGFPEPTSTVETWNAGERIEATVPPIMILPTDNTAKLGSSSTETMWDVTSTATPILLQISAMEPSTEHTGIIKPTLVDRSGLYNTMSNSILKTNLTPVFIEASTVVPNEVAATNTSVIVDGTTDTPFLPSNISKVINV